MVDLLDIDYKTNEVVVHPEALEIDIFKKIYRKSCKGDVNNRNRLHFKLVVSYILLMYKIGSPYLKSYVDEEERHNLIQKHLKLKDYDLELEFDGNEITNNDLVNKAVSVYKAMHYNISKQYLNAVKVAAHKTIVYLKDVDYNEKDDKGKLIYNPKDIIVQISKTSEILDEIEKMEKRVERDIISKQGRGGKVIGEMENPKDWKVEKEPLKLN